MPFDVSIDERNRVAIIELIDLDALHLVRVMPVPVLALVPQLLPSGEFARSSPCGRLATLWRLFGACGARVSTPPCPPGRPRAPPLLHWPP